jgi:hypothetical protein
MCPHLNLVDAPIEHVVNLGEDDFFEHAVFSTLKNQL